MTKSSSRSVALTAAAGLLAGVFAAQADAAEVSRTCIPFDQLVQTMRAEGQMSFFVGNKVTGTRRNPVVQGQFYYLNSDTNIGYKVQLKDPFNPDKKPECGMITTAFNNIRIHFKPEYVDNPPLTPSDIVLDSSVFVEENSKAVARDCHGQDSLYCKSHNQGIETAASNFEVPFLQANVIKSLPQSGETGLMTLSGVIGGPEKGQGSVWYTKPSGATQFGDGVQIGITKKALEFLREQNPAKTAEVLPVPSNG